MDFAETRKRFEERGIDLTEYEDAYGELIIRKVQRIEARPRGELGDARRIREYALVLRQILLHRAIKLFEGALDGLRNDNGYSMVLCVRGHYETTAAIGYLHSRLNSLRHGSLSPQAVDEDITTQILGTRDERILKKIGHEMPEAKQVLNLLEYADKSVSTHVLGGTSKQHALLMENYKFLCEFSHPNFHSHLLAFTINEEEECFVFRHDETMHERDAHLIRYLLVSNPLFVALYDRIVQLMPNGRNGVTF